VEPLPRQQTDARGLREEGVRGPGLRPLRTAHRSLWPALLDCASLAPPRPEGGEPGARPLLSQVQKMASHHPSRKRTKPLKEQSDHKMKLALFLNLLMAAPVLADKANFDDAKTGAP